MVLVYKLVINTGTTDGRVMKEARALARAGYRVKLICNRGAGFPDREQIDGISVHRFDCLSEDVFLSFSETDVDRLKDIVGVELAERFGTAAATLREGVLAGDAPPDNAALHAELNELVHKLNTGIFQEEFLDSADDPEKAGAELKDFLQLKVARRDALRLELSEALATWRAITMDAQARRFEGIFLAFAANLDKVQDLEPPDVIHAHDLTALLGAVMLARKLGGKVVYDAHEYEVERVSKDMEPRRGFIGDLEHSLLPHVSLLITVCDSIASLYREKAPELPIRVVMNAPEHVSLDTEQPDLRARIGLPSSAPVAVFTGSSGQEPRGLHLVCQALGQLPDVHLVALGPRRDIDDEWLMSHARNAGVEDRVHLLEATEARDVVPAIRSADVAVCLIQDASLSYRFALPNKLFEAAFAHVPLCVSDLPEMAAFVKKIGVGVVVDQTDPNAIADAIRSVLTDRPSYSNKAIAILNSEYSWRVQASKLKSAYREILGWRSFARFFRIMGGRATR